MKRSIPILPQYCENCQTELIGRYCHNCGQDGIPPKKSFTEIIAFILGSIFNWDNKFFLTLKYLIYKPGYLARAYVEGKRTKYVSPVKIFLFSSFIFYILFSTLFLKPFKKEIRLLEWNKINDSTYVLYQANTLIGTFVIQQNNKSESEDGTFQKQEKLFSNDKLQEANFIQSFLLDFTDRLNNNFTYFFWISLPFFALALKIVFLKHKLYYWDHFICSITLYSFFIISFIIYFPLIELLSLVSANRMIYIFTWGVVMLDALYLLLALKTFYQLGTIRAILKFLSLSVLFIFLTLPLILVIYLLFLYRDHLF
jgi:hypothetical protein